MTTIKKSWCSVFFFWGLLPSLISLFSLTFSSCKYIDYGLEEAFGRENEINDRAKFIDITNEVSLPTHGAVYDILLTSDMHFGGENLHDNGSRKDEKFFQSLDAIVPKPILAICLGDVAEHGWGDEMKTYNKIFVERLKRDYKIPTLTINGNHDLYNNGFNHYKDLIFPYTTFYRFKTDNLSYYFLDDASGLVGAKQFIKLRQLFRSDDRNKLIFMHIPLYAEGKFLAAVQDTRESSRLISLFNKNRVIGNFTGHNHEESESDLHNYKEYVSDAYLEDRAYYIVHIDEGCGVVARTRHFYD